MSKEAFSFNLDSDPKDALNAYQKYLNFFEEAKKINAPIIKNEVLKSMERLCPPREESTEFAGLYVHGGHTEMELEDHEIPFMSFRKFSEKKYPIYFFYHDNPKHSNDVLDYLCKEYEPIKVINIEKLESITEYSKFMIWKAFQALPEEAENVITFQSDGFFKGGGWEDWVRKHDPDYVGAPWWAVPLPEKDQEGRDLYVGNGGFSFRKRSKMLEVSEHITMEYIHQVQDGIHGFHDGVSVLEDHTICQYGFSKGIFKYIDPELAREFSSEPYNRIEGFGFHKFI